MKFNIHEHVRLQLHRRIGGFDADLQRTGNWIDLRLDIADSCRESPAVLGRQSDYNALPYVNVGRIAFENIGDHPNSAQIADRIEFGLWRSLLTRERIARDDITARRSIQRDSALRLASLFELVDLCLAEIPQFQASARGADERIAVVGGFGQRAALQNATGLESEQVILLGGEHLRAVDGQQPVAFFDARAHEVDEDLFDPALHLGMQADHAGLILRDLAGCTET